MYIAYVVKNFFQIGKRFCFFQKKNILRNKKKRDFSTVNNNSLLCCSFRVNKKKDLTSVIGSNNDRISSLFPLSSSTLFFFKSIAQTQRIEFHFKNSAYKNKQVKRKIVTRDSSRVIDIESIIKYR